MDDQKEVRDYLIGDLGRRDYLVDAYPSAEEALARLRRRPEEVALVILDHDLGVGRMDGLEALEVLRREAPELPVILLTGKGSTELAVKATQRGACDVIDKDPHFGESLEVALTRGERLLESIRGNRRLRRDAQFYQDLVRESYHVVAAGPSFRAVLEKAQRLASIPRPVLIVGERGTGKELVAAAIHYGGLRRERPFVKVNCAAFTGTLLESQLFGHEKGAFTGADARRMGRFEQADGGTLFLDEIANMAPEFQDKVLRVLEYQQFERVGGTDTLRVDVRVIAATNADLDRNMRDGRFRADLYDRLAFETIRVPPLRERREEIPALAEAFAQRIAKEVAGLRPRRFSEAALDLLGRQEWPGNVRQLRNVVERALLAALGQDVEPADLGLAGESSAPGAEPEGFVARVERYEKALLREALLGVGWNQKRAGERLGLSYDQVRHYYKKHDMGSDPGAPQ
ncbi:MAG: sigma-54-dependent Fis family transcriptional regulator [Planctomycetes bacterium]|nr:sigma-54-dependent Fis family transcriptional regulator [Planctomycetota bacterium]